jgi:hypothetical protein
VARKRLGDRPRRTADEEDLALSAFQCLCDGAKNGRFEGHMDRTDLWKLLLVITRQKVADHVRRVSAAKRGSGRISGESVFLAGGDDLSRYGIEHIAAEAPTPELLASLNEEFHRLMDLLHGQGDPRPPARFCRRVLGLGATTNSPQAQSRSPWNRVRAFQRPAGAFWRPKASDGGMIGPEKRPGPPTAFKRVEDLARRNLRLLGIRPATEESWPPQAMC